MPRKRAALIAALALAASVVSITPSQAADHLEAPLAQADGRTDINDLYAFQSPEDPSKTVLVMTVNPAAGALSPTTFDPSGTYEFHVDTDATLGGDDDASKDKTISIDFGTPNAGGDQAVTVSGAVSGSGTTGTEFSLDDGGTAIAGLYDDPFFFDFAAFQGTVKGMGSAQFCELEGDTTGVDFFAGFNVSAIVLEVDSDSITDAGTNIGVWAETGRDGIDQVDRMGRPAIATVLVPDGAEDAYNAADPDNDQANFADAASASLEALSAFGGDTGYTPAEADALADAFLPDILTIDVSNPAGYGAPLNGRGLADDVIDISLPVVTGDASAVGGPNVGTVTLTTDCVDANDKPFSDSFPYLAAANASAPAETTTYALILENLTDAQPFSPPVAVTHNAGLPTAVTVAELGAEASDELNAIARDGDPAPLVAALEAEKVLSPAIITDVVDLGRPLPPSDTRISGFADRAVYTIDARPGDVLSVFGMLICTNDGFTGLDRGELPDQSETFSLRGYDAGSEENTEMSEDIVDACSDLGPVVLDGDPDGNDDSAAVDTDPVGVIAAHPGVDGTVGDLLPAHGWDEPAASLTVVKIVDAFGDDTGDRFEPEINLLAAASITTGTSPTTYEPDAPVTRGQMATFISRSLGLPDAGPSPFTDIAGRYYTDHINRLYAAGITTGTSPTTFSPEEPMTRGQMAAFLNRALKFPAASSGPFTDTGGRYYTADVNALFAAGITTGTSSTTYSPSDTVTRSQEAGFLTRVLGARPITS
ncbi:MAG: DUF4331 family protein [Acidimicrobiales bacterium]